MKHVLLLYAGLIIYVQSYAQPQGPVNIGDIVPDIAFTNMLNSENGANSLHDLKGKLVILDFWATWCKSCMVSMPKMAALQKEFGKDLQIVLINTWEDSSTATKRLSHLKDGPVTAAFATLPVIYGDSSWLELFLHTTVPHHVWIDKTSKVIAITGENNATAQHVRSILQGQSLSMQLKQDLKAQGYNVRKQGLFKTGNVALAPALISGFFAYNAGYGGGGAAFTDSTGNMFSQVWLNNDIRSLYNAAYNHPDSTKTRILVDVKDKTAFSIPTDGNVMDQWNASNLYSYQITLPVKDKTLISEYMQQDLNRYFEKHRGITAKREVRLLPAWALTVKNKRLLYTKGGNSKVEQNGDSTYSFFNTPFNTVVNTLQDALEDMSKPLVLIDETGFINNVDMTLHGNLRDPENVRKQLARYGLELYKAKREVEVLCINDKVR